MKKIYNYMLKLRLNPRKEFTKLALIFFLLLSLTFALTYFFKNYIYLGFGLGFTTIFIFLYLNRYSAQIEINNKNNLEEFVHLFTFFKIYIHNGMNVYSSLKEITYFANPSLKELLDILISEIDEDKTVQPFIKFARNFNEIVVEEMMLSIYQIIDDGEQSNYLSQFELIFDKFSEVIYQKNLRAKETSLGTLSSAPLVGSCYLIILMTIGIVSVLGELINVI